MARVTVAAAVSLIAVLAPLVLGTKPHAQSSTYYNPILPGFHPDPSCIFVPEWDDTFFCASSSFNAFPGIPLHASKDLQNWKLIGKISSATRVRHVDANCHRPCLKSTGAVTSLGGN